MTITNGYCTLADIKHSNRLNFNDTDSASDEMLEGIIEAVSRSIDDQCNRIFYIYNSGNVQARRFTAIDNEVLFPGDMCSASSDSDVIIQIDTNGDGTYDDTFASDDYVLDPYNAEELGVPYQKIEVSSVGQYLFPKGVKRGVKVTAKWGWPVTAPLPIKQACILQSERLFKRFSTPLGSESMTALGRMTMTIPSLDPDVQMLISRYKKVVWG
jgi:hypothetical protein